MNGTKDRKPRRLEPEGLIQQELQDELMLFDPARNKAFCLNETAAFVWKNADGEMSVADLAQKMGERVNEEASEETVLYALSLLEKDGLIDSQTVAGNAVTRRELLRKIGISAIPVITVLFVRPPKAHASSMTQPSGPPSTPESLVNNGGTHHDGGFWDWLVNLFS